MELFNSLLGDNGLLNADVDFDLSDFDIVADDTLPGFMAETQEHILKPRISKADITRTVAFENAQAFSEQLDMQPGTRTYAWVNGSFIFGDLIEALWQKRRCDIKDLYVCSLSLSADNIDSLYNILEYSNIKHLYLVLPGYFYSHEKYGLIEYLYEKLDDPRVQIAFGAYHGKVFCFDTYRGNSYTCHGSANLRSSNSIEQICFETDPDVFIFNAEIIKSICDKYGTIKHLPREHNDKRLTQSESWEAVNNATQKE